MKTDAIRAVACIRFVRLPSRSRHADEVWCRVYAELSEQYQHSVKCTGAACDYFETKRKIVNARALADPRVIEANRLAYGEPNDEVSHGSAEKKL